MAKKTAAPKAQTASKDQPVSEMKMKEIVTCVNCTWFSEQPAWYGAHCTNPASEYNQKRVREAGSCPQGNKKETIVAPMMSIGVDEEAEPVRHDDVFLKEEEQDV